MTDAKQVSQRRLSFARLDGALEGATRLQSLFWLVMTLILMCPVLGRAQQLTATLTGTVTDSSGAVIPKATITVTQTTTNAARTVQSDDSGNYVLTSLPAGTYNVTVLSQGLRATLPRTWF